MEDKISKQEIAILIIIYLGMIYLWTLPFQQYKVPYGEGDAVIHFILADNMYITDKPTLKMPETNPVFAIEEGNLFMPGYLFYCPQFHTNLAISEIVGGERIVPFYLYLALVCSGVFFSVYLLLRKQFGAATAILASFLLIFSMRDRLTYLWGQWGTAITVLYVPLILYAYYRYTESIFENKEKLIYLYMTVILAAMQFLFHPLGTAIVLGMILVYTALISIREKRIPINKLNIKHFIIGIFLFFFIICLFAPLQVPSHLGRVNREVAIGGANQTQYNPIKPGYDVGKFERIFKWYDFPEVFHGIPDFYFSFKNIYYGYWMLPLLVLGIIFLVLRRKRKDLLMLSMIITFYIITHMDLINVYLGPKMPRLFYIESDLFYPLIAIGITAIPLFIKMNEKTSKILKYALVIAAIVAVLLINAKPSYEHFKYAYNVPQRLVPAQFEAANWINDHLPRDAIVMYVGTPTYLHRAWINGVSARLGVFDENYGSIDLNSIIPTKDKNINRTDYILMDYSVYMMMGSEQATGIISQLQEWEKNNTKGDTIYDKNGVKIYKVA